MPPILSRRGGASSGAPVQRVLGIVGALALLILPGLAQAQAKGDVKDVSPARDKELSTPVPNYESTSRASSASAPDVFSAPTRVYSHPVPVQALAFSPDGAILATGDASGMLRLWPLGSEEMVTTLEAQRRGVRALVYHPDGSSLASGGGDGLVHVFNARDLRLMAWLDTRHRGPISGLAFSGDGTRIVSASQDASILVRDVVTGQKLTTYFGHSSDVTAIVTAPESDCAVSGGADRSLQGWDLESSEQLDFATQPARVTTLAMSRDGSRLATAMTDGVVTLRRTTRCRVHTVALRLVHHQRPVRAMVFSPDGKSLFTAGDDKVIVRWDVESGAPTALLVGHQEPVLALALSPDGSVLASGGKDKAVRLWKLAETHIFDPRLPPPPAPARATSSRSVPGPKPPELPAKSVPGLPNPAGPSPD